MLAVGRLAVLCSCTSVVDSQPALPAFEHTAKALSKARTPGRNLSPNAIPSPITRFVMMPVSATMMIPVFGPGRSRVASVSTGLPQPSPQAALIEVTMATMTPMAERCAPGRKLNRPLLTGVRSPSAAAMSACAQLCRISASTNATNVSIMANGLAISPNNRMLLPGRYLQSLCAPETHRDSRRI